GIVLALACLWIAEPARKLREPSGSLVEGLKTLARIPLFRRGVLGYCAYTAGLGAFSFWAPTFIVERFETLTLDTANFWLGLTTIGAGIIGTVIGGRWADATLRHHPVTADTAFDDAANRRGTNALLRICAIGMVVAT